jgi:Undecaprenyl-phosphate galactose phosphotransferase WbaP
MLLSELINPPFYWNLMALIPIFLAVFALRGLYPAVGLSPVEELRRLSVSSSVVFLFFTAFTFWVRTAEYFSRLVIAFSWIFALATIPLCRWLFRIIATNLVTWGEPVAVIGKGSNTNKIVNFLLERIRFGIRPVVILDGDEDKSASIPRVSMDIYLSNSVELSGLQTAVLVDRELPRDLHHALLNEQKFGFRRLILISDHTWIGSLGVTPYDLEGLLGLEIRQNLLFPRYQLLKRIVDIMFSSFLGIITTPLWLLTAIIIRLDSRGSILFGHSRLGMHGEPITVWKFRTMVPNADQVLADYLAEHSDAKEEWQDNHKLKKDPRITRIGKLLRRTSLDEIPQLWNVLKGEMSMVGPRPIVPEEIEHYQEGYALYQRVRPGITGLWQVSGRTNTHYSDRVQYDEYYIRNWSIWLDIYIMLRTVWTVLRGEGAY